MTHNRDINMAKLIHISYTLFGIVLMASSCTNENIGGDGIRMSGRKIEFRASFPELTTRATQTTSATLEKITVCAYITGETSDTPYFTDKTFNKTGNPTIYVCDDDACVWPDNNTRLRFHAYSPSCEDIIAAGGEATSTDDGISGIKVPGDIASQFDFVTAISPGILIDNEESGVKLNFKHQLSRIELKAWGNSASYDLEIAGARIGGIGTGGDFSFTSPTEAETTDLAGTWENVAKGSVEYIFRKGDAIVTLDNSDGAPMTKDNAVSILGNKIGGEEGYDNSAMIVPSVNTPWLYKENPSNGEDKTDGMYISVLLRVKDTTPTSMGDGIVYPYTDPAYINEIVYLAVDKSDSKTVKTRLYRQGESYFTDPGHTAQYDPEADDADVKAFGWAALPAGENLKPGLVYTYTLNYSNGVGLRDPEDSRPGEPIISDNVTVNVEIEDWKKGTNNELSVPRK